jgi:hypothetical protein
MNAISYTDPDAATLARRLTIKAWIALIDAQLAQKDKDASSPHQRARTLLRQIEASGLGELRSPAGTDGDMVSLSLAGVTGRAINNGAAASLRLWQEAALDALAIL